MRILEQLIVVILVLTALGCQEEEPGLDLLVVPTNLQVNAEIVGADANNPNGDGSGTVHFTASAEGAISYQFVYNGSIEAEPSGSKTYNFSTTGVNTYTVGVIAVGPAGITTSTLVSVDVFASYEPPADLLQMLVGTDSRTWRIKSEAGGHFGLGPVGGSIQGEWYSASPDEKQATGMYDDRYIFNADGTFTHITNSVNDNPTEDPSGTVFGRINLIDELGPHNETPNGADIENYPFDDYTSQWTLSAPDGIETLTLAGTAFMGYYTGGDHSYELFSRNANEMILRTTDGNNEFDWWFILIADDGGSSEPVSVDVEYTNLVWADEFDTNGAPSATNWTYDIGTGDNGWGNGESQYYTDRADNVIVEDGVMKIIAKAESFSGSNYTSARVKSENLFEFTYGRVDIRAKLPEGGGTWPALWMLGANFDTVGWPNCGEMDIMEHVGNNQNVVQAAIHTPSSFGDTVNKGSISATNVSSEFHVYSVNWSENEISFLIDDEIYYTYNPSTKDASTWPFDADQFLIMNVAMGGTLGGTIDTGFMESTMEIDYVRVYQ